MSGLEKGSHFQPDSLVDSFVVTSQDFLDAFFELTPASQRQSSSLNPSYSIGDPSLRCLIAPTLVRLQDWLRHNFSVEAGGRDRDAVGAARYRLLLHGDPIHSVVSNDFLHSLDQTFHVVYLSLTNIYSDSALNCEASLVRLLHEAVGFKAKGAQVLLYIPSIDRWITSLEATNCWNVLEGFLTELSPECRLLVYASTEKQELEELDSKILYLFDMATASGDANAIAISKPSKASGMPFARSISSPYSHMRTCV